MYMKLYITICYNLPLYLAVPLDAFSHTAVSGAFLQYGSTRQFGSSSNVTLTVGASESVYCVQATGPVPSSIVWLNPQNLLVSRDGRDAVNQQVAGGGRIVHLTFHSYQQSQGGKYECRVAVSWNNTERVPVYICECYT